jgi:hypothetical protein
MSDKKLELGDALSRTRSRKPIPPNVGQPKTISREIFQLNPSRANVARMAGFCKFVSWVVVIEVTAKVKTMTGIKHAKYASQNSNLLNQLLKIRLE